jgi:hypothetical protein
MSTEPNRTPNELETIQNPALGAYALWQFTLGYHEEAGLSAPLPLAFLVLPLVLHRPTLEMIGSTRKASGLLVFAAKLADERENLFAVHERALLLRRLSLQSVGVGVTARLLKVEYETAGLRAYPLELGEKKPVPPERLKAFASAPEKLGYWFYKAGLTQVAAALRVDF